MGRFAGHARLRLFVVFLAIALAAATAVPATAAATLSTRITAILAGNGFLNGASGVRVYDLSTSKVLFARNAGVRLAPASNQKLATSTTALGLWGADYRFRTELYTNGTLDADGVYHGRLYLKGYGDPTLSTPWYMQNVLHFTTSNLADFVTALKNAGVKKIAGRVVGDESWFDSLRSVPSWTANLRSECTPLSALSLNKGTGPQGGAVSNPPLWPVRKLTSMLESAGIDVTRGAIVGTTPAGANLSYTEYSAKLSRILAATNKPSDNFFAEMLLKGLGKSFGTAGSTAAGVKVVGGFLVAAGLTRASFGLIDGSGLSYSDRQTAWGLTRLLKTMWRRDAYPVFYRSLAVAGVDGTLSDRMRKTAASGNLHGKTGTLAIASNLSGYVTTANGHMLAFSILMNKSGYINVWAAQTAQDAIGIALARSKPAGAITPRPSPSPTAAAAPASPTPVSSP